MKEVDLEKSAPSSARLAAADLANFVLLIGLCAFRDLK